MNYFINTLSPFAWEIFPGFGIRWYGLSYAVGLLIAWGILISLAKKTYVPLDAKARALFIFGILAGILVGGRLGFMLFYNFENLVRNPFSLFAIWEGGMSSHGGFLGVAAACWIFSRAKRMSFLLLTDAMTVMAPAGLLLGRLANFVNGELWGKLSALPWAVIFPKSAPEGTPLSLIAPRHPSQLYEAALEGLFLLIYTQVRCRQNKLLPHGQLTAEFLLLYAIVRIICEVFREPDATLILGLSRGVFYSLLMIPLAAGVFLFSRRKKMF